MRKLRSVRLTLVVIATLCACYIAYLGASFERAVEPEPLSGASVGFWLVIGYVAASPLWVPTLVPARLTILFRVTRVLGAVGTLFLLVLFLSAPVSQVMRAALGNSFDSPALLIGLVLSTSCILGLVMIYRLGRELRTAREA